MINLKHFTIMSISVAFANLFIGIVFFDATPDDCYMFLFGTINVLIILRLYLWVQE